MLKKGWFEFVAHTGLGFSVGTALIQKEWWIFVIGLIFIAWNYCLLDD